MVRCTALPLAADTARTVLPHGDLTPVNAGMVALEIAEASAGADDRVEPLLGLASRA